MEALRCLVTCNATSEVYRSLALFITYAYHKPTYSATSRTPKGLAGTLPIRRSGAETPRRPALNTMFDSADIVSNTLSKRQLGNKILEMYSDLLCEKNNTSNIRKFARTVTNKVSSSTRSKLGKDPNTV
jgi:hypothetical protein